MVNEVVVLDAWQSPFAMRVRIALAEKGIEFESKVEDFRNKSPLLLHMNPVHKKVPVLIHNGKPISESLIVVQYIDEVWNGRSPLFPSDPYQRAQVRFWADYVDKKIFDIIRKIITSKGEELEAAKSELIEAFKLLEEQLGDKPYFGGSKFGFVDIALVPFCTRFAAFEIIANLKIEIECPKFFVWAKRCLQRESVSKSVPDQQSVYEFIEGIRKMLGVE